MDAYVEDHTINGSDWAALLPRLTRPTRIWQGDDDNNVPAEATRWLAARIPGAELTVASGPAHGPRGLASAHDADWPPRAPSDAGRGGRKPSAAR